MEKIKEVVNNGINIYTINVNAGRLKRLKTNEINLMEKTGLIKEYQLLSSWGNIDNFNDFMEKSYHNQYDFYFNASMINSGGNEYMKITNPNKSYDSVSLLRSEVIPKTFEIDMIYIDEDRFSEKTIEYNPKLMSDDGKLFYANFNSDLNYGGHHTSVGYHTEPLIQITPMLYYIYKLLERKYSFINDAVERKYKIDKLLSVISTEFDKFIDYEAIAAINKSDCSPSLIKSISERKVQNKR